MDSDVGTWNISRAKQGGSSLLSLASHNENRPRK